MKHTKTPERIEYARRLRGEGATHAEIAIRLGISQTAVRQWLDADYVARHQAMAAVWQRLNMERVRELARERNRNLTREQLDKRAEYARNRYASNPAVRLKLRELSAKYRGTAQGRLASILTIALGGHRNRNPATYRQLMEAATGMNQKAFTRRFSGEGQLDHIIPLVAFDLTDPQQLVRSCHPDNLRVIPARDNQIKGDSYPPGIDIMSMPALGGQSAIDLAQALITRTLSRLNRQANQ